MYKYAIVNHLGGIEGVVSGPSRYIECAEGVEDTTHFFDGEIKEKMKLSFTTEKVGLEVSFDGLPEGLRVETNGMETVTDNEPLVIEYDVPGTYTINFSGLVNYLDHEMEVTVG